VFKINYRFGYLLLLIATLTLLFTEVIFRLAIFSQSLNINMNESTSIGRGSLPLIISVFISIVIYIIGFNMYIVLHDKGLLRRNKGFYNFTLITGNLGLAIMLFFTTIFIYALSSSSYTSIRGVIIFHNLFGIGYVLFVSAIIASTLSLYSILGGSIGYVVLLAIAFEAVSLIIVFADLVYSFGSLTSGLILVYLSLYHGIPEDVKGSVND
jgi:hypothetical protein